MRYFSIIAIAIAVVSVTGCEQTPSGDEVNAKIRAQPPEQRFNNLKTAPLSLPEKDASIDGLPVTDEQKQKWKAELRQGK